MPTHAPRPEKSYELVPQGTHMARCFELINIGTVQGEWKGQPKEYYKIRLGFELPTKLKAFGEKEEMKPMVISVEFTLSMGEKAYLRKFIEGMLDVHFTEDEAYAFDVEDVVGKACLIRVVHESKGEKTYANIEGAMPLMDDQVCPPAFNAPKVLSFSHWDKDIFTNLPEFIQKKIKSSKEYQARFVSKDAVSGATIDPNDIPF